LDEAEELLVSLILDGRLHAKIDQMEKIVELKLEQNEDHFRYTAIENWAMNTRAMFNSIFQKN
jgi:hypothetical protein